MASAYAMLITVNFFPFSLPLLYHDFNLRNLLGKIIKFKNDNTILIINPKNCINYIKSNSYKNYGD